ANMGNDVQTFSDFPAEIRAPQGTIPGVSGFQLMFSQADIHTPGDTYDALVAMNPAALKVSITKLKKGGILILDTDKFLDKDLKKANYEKNPIADGSLSGYRVLPIALTTLTLEA